MLSSFIRELVEYSKQLDNTDPPHEKGSRCDDGSGCDSCFPSKRCRPRDLAIANLLIEGDVDLYGIDLPFPLRLRGCRIEGQLNVRHLKVQTLDLRGTYMREFQGHRLQVHGDLYLTATTVPMGIDLTGAQINGRAVLDYACVRAKDPTSVVHKTHIDAAQRRAIALDMEGATIGQDVSIRRVFAKGACVLDTCSIGASLLMEGCEIDARRQDDAYEDNKDAHQDGQACCLSWPPAGSADSEDFLKKGKGHAYELTSDDYEGYALKARDMTVRGTIDIKSCVLAGEVRLWSAKAGGSVYFERVKIFGSQGRSILLDFSDIDDDLLFRGLEAHGAIRMRKAEIRGDLVFTPKRDAGTLPLGCCIQGGKRGQEVHSEKRVFGPIRGLALNCAGVLVSGDLRIEGDGPQDRGPSKPGDWRGVVPTDCLERVWIIGQVDFNNVTVGRKFRIQDVCLKPVEGRANDKSFLLEAPFLKVGADLRIEGMSLYGAATFEDCEIDGSVSLVPSYGGEREAVRRLIVEQPHPEALVFRRAVIGGGFTLDYRAPDQIVPSHITLEEVNPAFFIKGTVVLTNARIGGQVVLATGEVHAGPVLRRDDLPELGIAVSARASKIERGIYVGRGFVACGQMRFIEAKINDDVTFGAAHIELCHDHIRHHPYAIRFDRAVIDGDFVLGNRGEPTRGYAQGQVPSARRNRLPDGTLWQGPWFREQDGRVEHLGAERFHFVSRGGITLTGTHIDGTLGIHGACISSLGAETKSVAVGEDRHTLPLQDHTAFKIVTHGAWHSLRYHAGRYWRLLMICIGQNHPRPLKPEAHDLPRMPKIDPDHQVKGLYEALEEEQDKDEGTLLTPATLIGAIEARLVVVAKDIIIGNDRDPVFVDGQINLAAAQVGGQIEVNHTFVHGPQTGVIARENAFLATNLEVGLDVNVRDSIFISGMVLRQARIAGSCHFDSSAFIAYDLLQRDWRPGDTHYDLLQIDPGEIGLSTLNAHIGRNLKIRCTVSIYGVVQLNGVRVKQYLVFWLRTLRLLHSGNSDAFIKDLKTICEPFDPVAQSYACAIDQVSRNIKEPSLLSANRATVGGTFFMGLASDEIDTREANVSGFGRWEDRLYGVAALLKLRPIRSVIRFFRVTRPWEPGNWAVWQERYKALEPPSAQPKPPTADQDFDGYIDLTDVIVHTLKDSVHAWPNRGNIVLNGFHYDRIDQFSDEVTVDARDRVRWLKLSEPDYSLRHLMWTSWKRAKAWVRHRIHAEGYKRPKLLLNDGRARRVPDSVYDQLSAAYMRMGLLDAAEYVDICKRHNQYWSMRIVPLHRIPVVRWLAWIADRLILLPVFLFYWLLLNYGYQKWRAPLVLGLVAAGLYGIVLQAGPEPVALPDGMSIQACRAKIAQIEDAADMSEDARKCADVVELDSLLLANLGKSLTFDPALQKTSLYAPGNFMRGCIVPRSDTYQEAYLIQKPDSFDVANESRNETFIIENEAISDGGFFRMPKGYPAYGQTRFWLDSLIPVGLDSMDYWQFGNSSYCREKFLDLPLVDEEPAFWKNRTNLAMFYYGLVAFGYALLALILAAVTGLFRPSVKPPEEPSRFDARI